MQQVFVHVRLHSQMCERWSVQTTECMCARVCECMLLCVRVNSTHISGLSDESLLCVEDVFDASDQLKRTAVIRALKDKEHMCRVKAC